MDTMAMLKLCRLLTYTFSKITKMTIFCYYPVLMICRVMQVYVLLGCVATNSGLLHRLRIFYGYHPETESRDIHFRMTQEKRKIECNIFDIFRLSDFSSKNVNYLGTFILSSLLQNLMVVLTMKTASKIIHY